MKKFIFNDSEKSIENSPVSYSESVSLRDILEKKIEAKSTEMYKGTKMLVTDRNIINSTDSVC